MSAQGNEPDFSNLLRTLSSIRSKVRRDSTAIMQRWQAQVSLPAETSHGVANLAAYLALRHHDLRELQAELAHCGLSSLGRCESRVLPSLDAVCANLARLAGDHSGSESWPAATEFTQGFQRIRGAANTLFGLHGESGSGIMVTLPPEAAVSPDWCRELAEAGASCVRINCAHDTPSQWLAMIKNVRAAANLLNREIRIQMDLTGPRARTERSRTSQAEARVFKGDEILLARDALPDKSQAEFETVCSLPQVVDALRKGAMVYFNEGKLGAVVASKGKYGARLIANLAREKGEKFRADMGINVRGVSLNLPALTEQDRTDLDFVVQHADVVGYSFVQTKDDIETLHDEIARRRGTRNRREKLAVVVKIETPLAVRNLPEIIVHGCARAPLGVMIARGDLAVELGPVRMAEIQEELLWICEAAHVPVIWATQVLETLAKKGLASRAELTDAAMSERAECVMLNKGPYIMDAVRLLSEVLGRMADHQKKKTSTFRPLRSWEHLLTA